MFARLKQKREIKKLTKQYGTRIADGAYASGSTLTIVGTTKVPFVLNGEAYQTLVVKEGVKRVYFEKFPNLCTLYIGPDVEYICVSQTFNCPKLENIFVDGANKSFSSEKGVLLDKARKAVLKYPESKPDREFAIPEGVERIEKGAFMFAKFLQKVKLPKSLKRLIGKPFYKCESLKEVSGGESLHWTKFEDTPLANEYLNEKYQALHNDRALYNNDGELKR